MFTKKTTRALGVAAPAALIIALAAGAANAQKEDHFWSAAGNQGWTTGYGECWQSAGGPTDIPPCTKEIIEGYTINLVNDEFEFDKYFLKPDMKVALDDLARRVKASPGDEMLTIVGHTDAVGTEEYNLGLGQRRAESSKDYLVEVGGLDPSRIRVETQGESNPVATNETDEGRAQNRRIEVKAETFGG
jgi:OmpA-OmpF porin, OOP family